MLPDTKRRGGLDGLAACKDTSKPKLALQQRKTSARASSVPQQVFLRTCDSASLDADVFERRRRATWAKTTLACQRAV